MTAEVEHLRELFTQRFEAQDKAVQAALAAAALAVDKAEENAEKWRQNANEWRGAMGDRERSFVTRRELYAYIGFAIALAAAVANIIS